MDFSYIDLILALFLLTGLIRGISKGFFRTLCSLIAWIAGLFIAIHFSYFILDYLKTYLSWKENSLNIAAFILTFLIVALLFSLLGHLLTQLARMMAMGLLNRLMGGLFGVVKAAFILSILLMFFSSFNSNENLIPHQTVQSSVLYQPIEDFGKKITPSIMQKIKDHSPSSIPFDFFEDSDS